MKISKEKLKEIIKEELDLVLETELTRDQLQPEVEKILNKLPPEEQAIIRQFMILKN